MRWRRSAGTAKGRPSERQGHRLRGARQRPRLRRPPWAFGCNAARAIVTLEWVSAPGAKPPRRVAVECCPHCNEPHPVVAVMWRKPTERDADREPDLILIGVTPEPEPQR
jgi:hypothetical protein